LEISPLQKYCQNQQQRQTGQIRCQKNSHISGSLGTGGTGIELQRDQAGQRGNGCSQTANIDTKKQLIPVIGETGKQHGGGNIADHLAGKNRG